MHEGALARPGQLNGTDALAIASRVPRTVVDQVTARPIDLAIVDGISALSGGEGPWNGPEKNLLATNPGVLVVGRNPGGCGAGVARLRPAEAGGARRFDEYCRLPAW